MSKNYIFETALKKKPGYTRCEYHTVFYSADQNPRLFALPQTAYNVSTKSRY